MQLIVYLKKSLMRPVKLWTFVTFSSLSNLLCSTSTLAKTFHCHIRLRQWQMFFFFQSQYLYLITSMLEWAPCSHFAWNQFYKKYISKHFRGFCKSDSWPVYSFNDNFVRRLYHLNEENMMWLSSLPLSHWGKKAKIRPRLRILPWARFPESVEYLYSHFSHSAEKGTKLFL